MPRLNKLQLAKIKEELAKDDFILARNSGNKCYFEKKITEDYVLCLDMIYRVEQIDFWFHVHLPIFDPERIAYLIDLSYDYGLLGDFIKKYDNWFYKFKTLDIDLIEEWLIIAKNYLIQDFDTIQKCLETYDNDKYPDYTFNREMGWMYFGFLHAIYGDKKRAVELLEKFIDSILEYQKQRIGTNLEYLNDEKNGKWFDFYRIRGCQAIIEAIKIGRNREEVKELVRFHTELEETENKRRN